MAQVFSAEEPDGLRGPQFDAAWCDELAKWKHAEAVWDMLQFALRLGEALRLDLDDAKADPADEAHAGRSGDGRHAPRTAGQSSASGAELPARGDAPLWRDGLGRQELDGELIDDDPDALFQRDRIEQRGCASAPELRRIVVAVDPPAGHGKPAECLRHRLRRAGRRWPLPMCWRMQACSGARPSQWAARVVALYHGRKRLPRGGGGEPGRRHGGAGAARGRRHLSFRAVHAIARQGGPRRTGGRAL